MMVKKTLAIILTFIMSMMFLPGNAIAASFSDMPDDWCSAALEHAVTNGLLEEEDGLIMPSGNLTRAGIAAVITRALGCTQEANLSGYSDVPEDAWYYKDMAKAVQTGIFTGYDRMLRPESFITRQEVFMVLSRAFNMSDGNPDVLKGFKDADTVAQWAIGAVSVLIDAGYVSGDSGEIKPLSYITRAEFAQVMYNIDTISSVSIDQSAINAANETALSFTLFSAKIYADFTYIIDDTDSGTTAVTGSGAIATATDRIADIDVSSLTDGPLYLSVTVSDSSGNVVSSATDSITKDTAPPDGHNVSFDHDSVNGINHTAVSLTFTSAEVGAAYTYSIDDMNSDTPAVTGNGTIAASTHQITGIDISRLDDDTLTLTACLTDSSGNQAPASTDTVTKDTSAPSTLTVKATMSWSPLYPGSGGIVYESGTYKKLEDNYNNTGRPRYELNWVFSQYYIYWEADQWRLALVGNNKMNDLYTNSSDSLIPPTSGWIVKTGYVPDAKMTISY